MAELEELASFLVSPRPEVSRPTSTRYCYFRDCFPQPAFLSGLTVSLFSLATGNRFRQVQRAAVEIVAGLTGSEEGLEKLRSYTKLIASALLPLLPSNKASRDNLTLLAFLSGRSMHRHLQPRSSISNI